MKKEMAKKNKKTNEINKWFKITIPFFLFGCWFFMFICFLIFFCCYQFRWIDKLTFHKHVPDQLSLQHQLDCGHVKVNEAKHHASMGSYIVKETHLIFQRRTDLNDKRILFSTCKLLIILIRSKIINIISKQLVLIAWIVNHRSRDVLVHEK